MLARSNHSLKSKALHTYAEAFLAISPEFLILLTLWVVGTHMSLIHSKRFIEGSILIYMKHIP